uniref:NADH dehydrogenase subunit 2 n=1 Tax=Chrysopetalum debile TaxID=115833 RepID=UPI001EDD292F|nr:NADH dehydrogenase subunit 2 [Chrysopetalum debile]UJV31477.1 NADH dehydrogenase subunit 2 [Chrysopetalum debile]
MNHSTPHIILFSTTLFMGTLITLMSNQWVFLWVGLEINLLSIIPLMLASSDMNESESSIKYFIVQAIGGALILMASISHLYAPLSILSPKSSAVILLVGLLIKLGAAPLHFWFPQVMNGLNWLMCLILCTWQKLAPLMLLTFLFSTQFPSYILLFGILSIWIGGLGGLNQTQLRPLFAYSSISHVGWMLSLSFMSSTLTLLYFSIYILSSMPLMLMLWSLSYSSNSLLPHSIPSNPGFKMTLMLLLLNLGGIPPFLGFFPKLAAVQMFNQEGMMAIPLIMVMGSMISLFYYLSILFNSYLSHSLPNINKEFSWWLPTPILTTIALLPLPLMISMI